MGFGMSHEMPRERQTIPRLERRGKYASDEKMQFSLIVRQVRRNQPSVSNYYSVYSHQDWRMCANSVGSHSRIEKLQWYHYLVI